jgi:hypothetical protein
MSLVSLTFCKDAEFFGQSDLHNKVKGKYVRCFLIKNHFVLNVSFYLCKDTTIALIKVRLGRIRFEIISLVYTAWNPYIKSRRINNEVVDDLARSHHHYIVYIRVNTNPTWKKWDGSDQVNYPTLPDPFGWFSEI